MKILVLVKEVPVVSDIRIDRQTLKIDRSGVGNMMNISDRSRNSKLTRFLRSSLLSAVFMSIGYIWSFARS